VCDKLACKKSIDTAMAPTSPVKKSPNLALLGGTAVGFRCGTFRPDEPLSLIHVDNQRDKETNQAKALKRAT
jgi:hypothetical protein